MNTANQTSLPERDLAMTVITIEVQGVRLVRTEEEVDRLAAVTGQPKASFARDADGTVAASLGDFRLVTVRNRSRITHRLRNNTVFADHDIRQCCRIMAAALENAPDGVEVGNLAEMLVIHAQAMAATTLPFLPPGSGPNPEANLIELARSEGGRTFPIWHRLTPGNDPMAGELFGFHLTYDATAVVVVCRDLSRQMMEDVALALMGEMIRIADQGDEPYEPEPDLLSAMAIPTFFNEMVHIFLDSDYGYRRNAAHAVANALMAGHLTAPDGALEPTVGALRRLAQGSGDLIARRSNAPSDSEDHDTRAMALLERIRRHNWPSEDDDMNG